MFSLKVCSERPVFVSKLSRAYCQRSIRCAALKSPKDLFSGKPMICGVLRISAQDVKLNMCRERPVSVAQNVSLIVLECVWLTAIVCVLWN